MPRLAIALMILFWIATAASILWSGAALLVHSVINGTYHPLAVKGDLLIPVAAAVPVLTAIAITCLWARRQRLGPTPYAAALAALAVGAVLPFTGLRIDSGYRETFYLGDTRYEVPWQYDPATGTRAPGGTHFSIRATLPDLIPRYDTDASWITLTVATDYNFGKGGDAPEETSRLDRFHFECEWKRGDRVYRAFGDHDLRPDRIEPLFDPIADLLDSLMDREP